MNYQIKQMSKLVDKLFKLHEVTVFDTNYYVWPQMFGSTSGPCPGISGQAMTLFSIEAFVDITGDAVCLCNGMYAFIRNLELMSPVNHWCSIPEGYDAEE